MAKGCGLKGSKAGGMKSKLVHTPANMVKVKSGKKR